jgi:hypothetical protein
MKYLQFRTTVYALAAVFAVGVLPGCKKDFLDLRPYTSLTPEDALKTEGDLRVAITQAYAEPIFLAEPYPCLAI